ncbi:MAG: homocysteine S-methyltransferase family protein [Deltaproteobacteria bacterium]|nr:homocysteine S-methyltransferase family protein [Deltaproteobacteria bacterium]MBW2086250.1 homocysteine S-methyltransferase family protein [Deltaproteobacteria bacterium]
MHSLIKDLIKTGVVVTDGSWGTQLYACGLKQGENPDSWNLYHPEKVEEVARQYVDAGSRVILTNTFGANKFILEKFGLADKVVEINTAGVKISKKVAGDRAYVFASIGPSGKMLVMKEVTEDDLGKAFEEQAHAQAQAGADGIIIETMSDLAEARIAVSAVKPTGLPIIASMVFDSGKNKDRTMMGTTPEEVVEELVKMEVDGIGANCGQGIEGFIPICRRMRSKTELPIWIKPNAGLPEVADGKTVYRTTARDFVRFVPELIQAGANFIGGCCGTDQEYIKEINKAVAMM